MNPPVNPWLHLIPLALSVLFWFAFHRFNRRIGFFRLGEEIFWDAIALVVIFLFWLRFF